MKKFFAGFFLALMLASGAVLIGQTATYNLGPIQFRSDGSHTFATTPIVAAVDATAQAANISTTTLYAVPAGQGGMYRVSCYSIVTQAATTSSTLPACGVNWTDNDTGTANDSANVTGTCTFNSVGLGCYANTSPGALVIGAKAGTNISYLTGGYASSGATPMQYAVHIKLEYLGN